MYIEKLTSNIAIWRKYGALKKWKFAFISISIVNVCIWFVFELRRIGLRISENALKLLQFDAKHDLLFNNRSNRRLYWNEFYSDDDTCDRMVYSLCLRIRRTRRTVPQNICSSRKSSQLGKWSVPLEFSPSWKKRKKSEYFLFSFSHSKNSNSLIKITNNSQ